MTMEEAIEIFLNRGWIEVDGGTIFDGNKWREAIKVISDYFRNEYKASEQELRKELDFENLDVSKMQEGIEQYINSAEDPCDHAISRQAALNCLTATNLKKFDFILQAREKIKNLPPKTDAWIPVSKGLPKENKTVIASTKFVVYPEARYTKENGWEWAYESGADYWVAINKTDDDVTAWMPLPKRYNPQEESEGK